jgi:hypothetical protein
MGKRSAQHLAQLCFRNFAQSIAGNFVVDEAALAMDDDLLGGDFKAIMGDDHGRYLRGNYR